MSTPAQRPFTFRKKPVAIQAMRWDNTNDEAIRAWAGDAIGYAAYTTGTLYIETLEGTMRANAGDYIIRGVAGEIYPCKPDIFNATYEMAEGVEL